MLPLTITVSTVARLDEANDLLKQVEEWRNFARNRHILAFSSPTLSEEKKRLALDSKNLTQAIFERIVDDFHCYTIYKAVDGAKNLQGIAFAKIQKGCNRIEFITTNPHNLAIFPGELAQGGIGKKLVLEVVKDVFHKVKNNKNLFLKTVPSACKFYSQLGFVRNKNQMKYNILTPLVLSRAKMAEMLSRKEVEKEIILTHLPPLPLRQRVANSATPA